MKNNRHREARQARALAAGVPVDGLPYDFAGQITLDGQCWRWHGQHDPDGRPRINGNRVYRVLYRLLRGPLGSDVLHHQVCNHPWCANPFHVEPMTQSHHMKVHGFGGDRQVGQAKKTHCPSGHPYDEANTMHSKGKRWCRTCYRASRKRSKVRLRAILQAGV